jgi:hypothetical protein
MLQILLLLLGKTRGPSVDLELQCLVNGSTTKSLIALISTRQVSIRPSSYGLFVHVEQSRYMMRQTRPSFSSGKISSICPTSLCIAARARFQTFLSTLSYPFFFPFLLMLKKLAAALLPVLLKLHPVHPPSEM